MSYLSLLKNVPGVFGQPTGIAAIASLGIHGAIAMIVPLMPVDSTPSQETEPSRTVGLMELSPSDLSRLPQSHDTSQQVALQPPPGALQQPQVGLEQPALPLQQQIPPANSHESATIIPPLQTGSSQPLVSSGITQSPSGFAISSLPKGQTLRGFSRDNFRTDITAMQTQGKYTVIPPTMNHPGGGMRETLPNINGLPQNQSDNQQSLGKPLKNPSSDAIDPESTVPPLGTEPRNSQQPIDDLGDKTKGPLAFANPAWSKSPGSLFNLPPQSTDPTKNPETQPKTTGETPRNQLNAFNTLRDETLKEYPNIQEKGVIRETITTDKAVKESNVLGRLVVDPNGKVLDIKFQDKLISPELQSKVRDFFLTNPPKGSKHLSSYPFDLRFKNDHGGVTTTAEKSPTPNSDPQKGSTSTPDQGNNKSEPTAGKQGKPSPISQWSSNSSSASTQNAKNLINLLNQEKEKRKNSLGQS